MNDPIIYHYGDGRATNILVLDKNLTRKMKLTLEAKKVVLGTTVALLVVQSSFRNQAYRSSAEYHLVKEC